MFYFDKINGKKILKSDLIDNAFFTTREICICDKGVNNNLEVKNNINIIENYLGNNLISPTQTHSANIQIVKPLVKNYPDTDGLILIDNSQAIFLNFADCVPLIFYDKKQNIGAISHAGWRGTAQKIGELTVKKLIQKFNSNINDICAVIGPAICENCYEVGEEVYSVFNPTKTKQEPTLYDRKVRKLNLKEINRKQLAQIGIKKIDICPYCTCCDNEYFFSYRKEHGTTLRHSAILALI
ncbi:peptidoglycan editing factor PgeF [bacterium]|nr:peptidoglycan editing factor PgeF [bacterium]